MSPAFSIYLDLMRFLAACLVVIYHSNSRLIVEAPLPLAHYGHSAVIVFFVLSGFVIAYATDTKERSAKSYWASRLSRVLSLAVPVVLLTPLLDMVGEALAPALYAGNTTHGLAGLRIASSLLFLNEIWSVSIMSFSNVAYWSLNYEVWYYALFALHTFTDRRRRWWWIALVALLLGPKIVLLAPIWLLGVLIYRWQLPRQMPEWLGWLCVTGSVALFVAFDLSHLEDTVTEQLKLLIGAHWHRELAFSRWFLTDYLLAGIVFLNFLGMQRVVFRVAGLALWVARPVRAAAAFTFSIYILHQPLIYFFAALIDLPPTGYLRYAAVMACVLATIIVVGSLTERRRFALRRCLLALFDWIECSRLWPWRVRPIAFAGTITRISIGTDGRGP